MNDVIETPQNAIENEWSVEIVDAEDFASDDEYAAIILRSTTSCTSC